MTMTKGRCLCCGGYVHCTSGWPEKLAFRDSNKGYWNVSRKLGITTHFSKIIKLQFGKKCHTSLGILNQ